MCFLFKEVIEIRKKLLKNREKGISYVSTDCDPNVLEKETMRRRKDIHFPLKSFGDITKAMAGELAKML